MPDLTMCNTAACPSREQCYRHRAVPGNWQSWANFDNVRGNARVCTSYLPIMAGRRLRPSPEPGDVP